MTFSSGLGSFFRRMGAKNICAGRLRYTWWSIDVAAPGFRAAAVNEIARAYVGLTGAWAYRDAAIGAELPAQDRMHKGDFGEIIAGSLFNHRLGYDVPFQKLAMRPAANVTVQGPDVMALTLHGDRTAPYPTLVEAKVRPAISPKEVLEGIKNSLNVVTEGYVISAWRAATRAMRSHPAYEKQFALSAAELLAHLTAEPGTYPEHDKQAVIITARQTLSVAKIEEHWAEHPPVTELHVIAVANLEALMNSLYEEAAKQTYGHVASAAPHLVTAAVHTPGLAAPVVSDAAVNALRLSDGEGSPMLLVEASLWLLADWDGMGTARAKTLAATTTNLAVEGLAHLLAGRAARGQRALRDDPVLLTFANAVAGVWALKATADELSSATLEAADAIDDPGVSLAVGYVGAAIRHRLPRHPVTMTESAGATGSNVRYVVVDNMLGFGKRAFWPSQAAAIEGGLLDRDHPSMAIKMPTSAGKTMLIELVIADALDSESDSVAIVLAPTKALVRQLSSDLRKALPRHVAIRSSHGGLDFDVEGPSSYGLMTETGVVVVTPERFDLKWRQAVSDSNNAAIDRVRLLVVDEAHLITEMGRGPRLELILGRALRRGIRVVLLSSQLPAIQELAGWLDGKAIESDWTPTWLQRHVYFQSPDRKAGLLRAEAGDAAEVLRLTGSNKPGNGECRRGRASEAAALAEQHHRDGLVVVYSHQRRWIGSLVEAVDQRFSAHLALDDPELKSFIEPIKDSDPEYAHLLRMGIGVHHANVPRRVRTVVEVAARKSKLRCIVCSPTLLEGVDFPTKTVVAAYPPEIRGRAEVGKLRNLAGRAGRGALFASGVLIVMAPTEEKAKKWLVAFRAQLPPTRSALTEALRRLFSWGQDVLNGHRDTDSDEELLAVVDATVLAAIAEGAVIDGDLRRALEDLLGRTLWYAGASAVEYEKLLERAMQRAQFIAGRIGSDHWSKTFYRSGLPIKSCLALRDVLTPTAAWIYAHVNDVDGDHDGVLLWLASEVGPVVAELAHWRDLVRADIRDALKMWLYGEPEESIEARHAEAWKAIGANDLDTLVPWVLTAGIDIVATQVGSSEFRELAHRRLAPVRLRYGVPSIQTCELVRDGFDRDDAMAITTEFQSASLFAQLMGLREYGQQRRREREAALQAAENDDVPF